MSADKPKSIVQQYVQEQVAKEMEPFYKAFGRGTDKSRAEVFAGWLRGRVPLHQHDRDAIAAELRRLDESERELLKALQSLCADKLHTQDDWDDARELIAKTKEARNG